MSKPIFISYRRDYTVSSAKLLKSILEAELGANSVFLDTSTLNPGDKFSPELKEAVRQSRVVIAFIGPYWKGLKYWESGNENDKPNEDYNRLFEPDDWVRIELETALADPAKLIIPLVFFPDKTIGDKDFRDSEMFAKGTLPRELLPIAGDNNKARVRENEFENDLRPIIMAISKVIATDDALEGLELPPFDRHNPLDQFPKSPFKGFEFFEEKDARIFFGRSEQIRELYNKIESSTLVLLYGQSGVGKSSLLFAGLKRRMEHKNWRITYYRREGTSNLAEKIETFLKNPIPTDCLVILDQIEEIETNRSKILTLENEIFLLIESVQKLLERKVNVVLSFREEHLSWIKERLEGASLTFKEMRLRNLQVKGVIEAILGITRSSKVMENYQLTYEEREIKDGNKIRREIVADKIASLVLTDEQSHIAPLLQALLRKLWDLIPDKDDHPVITFNLFEKVRSQSLSQLVEDQIKVVEKDFPEQVNSGLALSLLNFFTTSRSTAATHSYKELEVQYDQPGHIKQLCESLKNNYLLLSINEKELRLSHDSLAPIIRELYAASTLPGQRAARLLDSKQHDIEKKLKVDFSKEDINIIDSGRKSMRKFSANEFAAVESSQKKREKEEKSMEEKNKELEVALKEANAKRLVSNAREIFESNPTLAIRLAEASIQLTAEPSKESLSAFRDFFKPRIGLCKNIIQHSGFVNSLAFSPDGKQILAGKDSLIQLFDLKGKIIKNFRGHTGMVRSVAFSPDGKFILSGGDNGFGRLWNLKGKTISILKGHKKGITAVTFAPNGRTLATGSYDGTVRLWNSHGRILKIIRVETNQVDAVAFSSNSEMILTGSSDGKARLFDLKGKLLKELKGHTHSIYSVCFSPDGKSILTGSFDGTVRLWDVKGKKNNVFEVFSLGVIIALFSPNGEYILACANETQKLLDLYGNTILDLKGHTYSARCASFSPDGKSLITDGGESNVMLWDLTSIPTPIITQDGQFTSAAFSPDSKSLVVSGTSNNVSLFNLKGKIIQTFSGHTNGILSVTFSQDGNFLLTGSRDGTARLWDLSGNCIQIFKVDKESIRSVCFIPDGKSILTGSSDGRVRQWDINGNKKRAFTGHTKGITSLAISSDGNTILSGSYDHTVRLWSLNGNDFKVLKGHTGAVYAVAFSNDGSKIITAGEDRTARIWDLKGNTTFIYKGHEHSVNAITFSPDDKCILSGSSDRTARFWNKLGITMQLVEGHQNSISCVALSPDGKYFFAGSDRGSLNFLERTFWEKLNTDFTAIPTPQQMKEYDIPENIEWGKW